MTFTKGAEQPLPVLACLVPRQGCLLERQGGALRVRWQGEAPPGLASAMLWGQDHALTAGHCMHSELTRGGPAAAGQCLLLAGPQFSSAAFAEGQWQTAEKVLEVARVLAGAYQAQQPLQGDWALLAVTPHFKTAAQVPQEHPVPELAPTPLPGQRCFRAVPSKNSDQGEWVVTGNDAPLWLARLHTAPGLSGSPVMDEQGRLAGLLLGRVGQAGDFYRRWLPGAATAGPLRDLARVMPARHFASQLPTGGATRLP